MLPGAGLRDMFGGQGSIFGGQYDRQRGSGSACAVRGYTKIRSLGRGGMSEAVNLVRSERSGRVYVEKRVRIDMSRRQRTLAELSALRRVEQGRNLNQLHTYLWDERAGLCTFVLEYFDRGSLEKSIEDNRGSGQFYPDMFVWHVLTGISSALAFLHRGVRDVARDRPVKGWDVTCHLDLKPCKSGSATVFTSCVLTLG